MGPSGEPVPVVPADAFATLPSGPLRSGEDFVPPTFLIGVDLHNGRWLTIGPSRQGGAQTAGAVACLHIRRHASDRRHRGSDGAQPDRAAFQLATAADALGRSTEIIETPRPAIREFAAIHNAFETMQKRLKRFVDERTHTLAAISHDLRTPLTRLKLQAEFIADGELREGMLANIDAMRDMLAETLSFAEGHARPIPRPLLT